MRLETDYINQMITIAISYLIKRDLFGTLPNKSHKPNDNKKRNTFIYLKEVPGYNEPRL